MFVRMANTRKRVWPFKQDTSVRNFRMIGIRHVRVNCSGEDFLLILI